MYFALVYYPKIEQKEFHLLRNKYEPYANLLPEHLAFLKPVPGSVGEENLKRHIKSILIKWEPFNVHFYGLEKSWDHWLLLVLKEGNQKAIKLHDELYSGILSPYLRKDLPYTPHVGLGLFSKENYDVSNPTAQLSLDEEKYQSARAEFKNLGLDFWRTIDHLTLVKINPDFSRCWDIMDFRLND
jgi:hypothetical protein